MIAHLWKRSYIRNYKGRNGSLYRAQEAWCGEEVVPRFDEDKCCVAKIHQSDCPECEAAYGMTALKELS